jgi:hypothetical protein
VRRHVDVVLAALLTHAPAPVITDTPGTFSATELVVLLSHLGESLALFFCSAQEILGYFFLTLCFIWNTRTNGGTIFLSACQTQYQALATRCENEFIASRLPTQLASIAGQPSIVL